MLILLHLCLLINAVVGQLYGGGLLADPLGGVGALGLSPYGAAPPAESIPISQDELAHLMAQSLSSGPSGGVGAINGGGGHPNLYSPGEPTDEEGEGPDGPDMGEGVVGGGEEGFRGEDNPGYGNPSGNSDEFNEGGQYNQDDGGSENPRYQNQHEQSQNEGEGEGYQEGPRQYQQEDEQSSYGPQDSREPQERARRPSGPQYGPRYGPQGPSNFPQEMSHAYGSSSAGGHEPGPYGQTSNGPRQYDASSNHQNSGPPQTAYGGAAGGQHDAHQYSSNAADSYAVPGAGYSGPIASSSKFYDNFNGLDKFQVKK